MWDPDSDPAGSVINWPPGSGSADPDPKEIFRIHNIGNQVIFSITL